MENTWSDLVGHAPAGPVRDALEWVAGAVDGRGPLSAALLDDRLRLAALTGRQALARLEELRRLRRPFRRVEVEAKSPHAADLRFLTADDLHVRLHCQVWEHEPRHLRVLRLDWIGPEEIPLTDWEQVPDLLAHYPVPALSVAWSDGTGEPVGRAWGADPATRFAACSVSKPLTAVAVLANRDGGSPLYWSAMTLGAMEAAGEDLFVTQRSLTEATNRAVRVFAGQQPPRAAALPDGAAGTYRVRPGYELIVTDAPGGPAVTVPGQPPIPLLGGDDGCFPLEGLATSLRFIPEGGAVLRQGPEEWTLSREPA
jgi:hypothetical protein